MELDVGGDGVEERMRTSSSFIQGGTCFLQVFCSVWHRTLFWPCE